MEWAEEGGPRSTLWMLQIKQRNQSQARAHAQRQLTSESLSDVPFLRVLEMRPRVRSVSSEKPRHFGSGVSCKPTRPLPLSCTFQSS